MTRFPRTRTILLSISLAAAGLAQAQQPLSLEDCVNKALAVPSAVSIARLDREIADKGRLQSRAGFLPQSSIALSHAYNSPSRFDRSTVSYVALNGIREFSALASIFQEIDTSGKLRADYARAKAEQDVAGASLAIAQRDLKRAVAGAYYRVLLARHVAEAIRSTLEESESFEQRVRVLAQGGEAARADIVKASAQAAFLRQSLTSAELAADLANQDLAAYWTDDVVTPLDLVDVFQQPIQQPPAIPAPNPAPFLRRSEFQLFDALQRSFEAQSRGAKAAMLPQLSWDFQYGMDASRLSFANRGYAAFFNLNIPVFDWFRALNSSRQYQAQAAQVGDRRAIARRAYSAEYQAALSRVTRSYEQVTQTQQQVSLTEEDLRLSRIRYEGGEGPALDVVTAQSQVAQARSNYFSSIADYLNARLDLEVASGQ